jgi:phosphate ABC transporter phosphate-binding protein
MKRIIPLTAIGLVGLALLIGIGCSDGGGSGKGATGGKGLEKPLRFSGAVLADIFRRKITRWDDERLKELNPGVMLPAKDIKVVHRSDGSGTNYIFTEFLSKVSPAWEKEIKFGTSVNWPEGTVGERGNEGVSKAVKESPGAIGYVELLYALKIKMAYGAVQNRAGQFIHADLPSVTAAAKGALQEIPDDLRFSLTNAAGENAYPISGTVWAIAYVNQPPDKAQPLTHFLRWVTHEGQGRAADLHYARLPQELIQRIDKKLAEIKGGAGGEGATRLNGAGSSFVYPMMTDWAKVYRTEKGIEINYQSKGSSTGIEQMTEKAIDFGCSDAPMNAEQLKRAEAKGGPVVHIPLVMGAVVPVYNLEGAP